MVAAASAGKGAMLMSTATAAPLTIDSQATREFLGCLIDPSLGCSEIRVLEATVDPRSRRVVAEATYSKTIAAWGNSIEHLVRQAERIHGVSAYITVNPVNPALMARSDVLSKARATTTDKDIECLSWLFLDFDAKRPTGISSTAEELGHALARRDKFLADHPQIAAKSVWGCSGNGAWLLVRLPDYPNDEEHRGLIERAVGWLAGSYSDGLVELDVSTKNPARIMPLVGTVKCKGISTAERPWRRVTMDSPADKACLPFDLKAFVALHVREASPGNGHAKNGNGPLSVPRVPMRATNGASPESRARAYIFSNGFPESIEGNKGHSTLYRAACELVDGFGLSEGQALPILRDWNAQKAHPPEDEKQVQHKIQSALKNHPAPSLRRLNAPSPRASASANRTVHQAAVKLPVFSNFSTATVTGKNGKPEEISVSLRIGEIADQLNDMVPGWPKRVGEMLFIPTPEHQPVYLESAQRLMAWVDSFAKIDWTKGSTFITQERFFEHLRMTVDQYDAIETLPHWPAIPGIYYLHRDVPGPADMLERLLDFFSPAGGLDRELVKAMVLTLFWGGSPGSRPAFLVTGPDQDPEQGRGVGKSNLCQILADELAGGFLGVSPTDAIADVKTRLLSTDSGRKRVVMLDNVKTHKFSWADLEGLITASEISGRALYVGEGRRPNTLVWMITLNGATLSKDMAQRCIQIKLDRPAFKASWEMDVRDFIRSHRWGILGDIRALLEADSQLIHAQTRWAAWERDVLGKTLAWGTLQTEIRSRQHAVDDDDDERLHVAQFFVERLDQRGHDPDKETVRIPSLLAAEWVSDATRTKYPTNRASAFLSGLAIPQLRKSNRGGWRGWIWTGLNTQDKDARKLGDPPVWATATGRKTPY